MQEGVVKMKVWEKIAELNNGQIPIFLESCPSILEQRYHILGDKRFKKHCSYGCGVKCTEEYLNLEVKGVSK